ncbi:MAG: Transglutaminase domain protein [Candidatus Collierbacteria bacterium GW2011_GWC2_44_18]|uniref:Transglutaminase domain protein n=2 Tax=Microgenomates group TaxID=1794810 RepID=A0A0G1J4Z3_9BACT|nr:MAG: Transglutaminase domain protein [Candidatus Collierbacteria bacterium GW2011_GWC2_44_18]KKT66355.1 MAG: Transglutaminase domain protein [Candidatus Woesebacteria bacterium GW2011_GWA2_44_33]
MPNKFTFLIFIVLGIFLIIFPKGTFALAKFNTTYQIYYQIEDSGKTHVKFVINQKNNLSVVYATNFGLSVNETKIENIRVLDEGTSVTPDVIKSLNQTSISFPFTSKVVGKDKNHTFTIEYYTTDITIKSGNTWQIDIPRLEPDENVTEQTVYLTVPSGFSDPTYIDPKPDIVNGNVYYFSDQKISNKSISAIFGKTQYYKGKLSYHLVNNEKKSIRTEIALPPDTSYQTVYFQNIDPKPEEIVGDHDGNFLAKYTLTPGERKDITVDLVVKLDFTPKPTNIQPSDSLLAKNSVWNYDNGVFSTAELRNLKSSKSIYDFVSDKLKYDYEKLNRERPTRSPAAESLINSQSAICTDFTNIFVALARKSGIPARELEGFAISENPDLKPLSLTQDVLHAWPEYFDKTKSTWIQIDPTWANTTRGIDYFNKLDFNHIVFVIHGENPEYPVPAGGYKNGQKSKDVYFEPIENISFPSPDFSLQFLKQENNDLLIQITNNSGVLYYGSLNTEESEYIEKSDAWVNILPLSNETVRLRIKKQPFAGEITSQAIIYLNGKRYETGFSFGATSSKAVIYSGIGGFLAITAFGARYLYLRRQKQKTTLYR